MKPTIAALLFFLLANHHLFAQVPIANTDSSARNIALPDSGLQIPRTTKSSENTNSPIQPTSTGLEAKVDYSARVIDSRKPEGTIYLLGDAQVKYKDITIKAGKITIKWNENLLIAEAIPDTSVTGAVKKKLTQFPHFSDGKEKMVGEKMEFNFKSEKGRIIRGRTEFQKGHYFGDAVKIVDPDVFYVKGGRYSTCDLPEPHYSFKGQKMKVIANDKVLAKPVTLFMGKIPVAIFPFAMFPAQESGRSSGIILPQFGSSPTEGNYLRNMGYYWATNDYMDMQFTLDFYDRTGILFRGKTNYALRYKFTGGLDGSLTFKNFPDGRRERRWNLNVRHSQTIDENTRLSVNGSFVSNNSFYKEFSSNRSERLNRQIQSNATFSKRWGDGKNSLTLNLRQVKDVESGSETLTLPQLRYSRSRSALIPFKEDPGSREKKEPKWFNEIYYTYSTDMSNVMRDDTTSTPPEDTRQATHRLSFSHSPRAKLFDVIGFNQSMNYSEDWFDRRKTNFTLIDSTNQVTSEDESGFFRRYRYTYSAGANTNLFGTVYPGIFGITAMRHKMSPSVSFSFQPDLFSGSPRGETRSLNFTLNNLFQMKVGKGESERIVKLFDLNFSTGYNFAADSLKLRDLSSRVLANPAKALTLSANTTHTFYRFDDRVNTKVNEFIRPRLTSFRLDARWTLSGGGGKNTNRNQTTPDPVQVAEIGNTGIGASGEHDDRFAPESAFSALDIPWRANISLSYNVSKSNPDFVTKSAYFDLSNVEVQLTKKWRLGYRLRYDIEKKDIIDQRLSFYRDLHCWEARFDWSPTGFSKGFYFIINVKASHLRQLKWERRGGRSSVFSSF